MDNQPVDKSTTNAYPYQQGMDNTLIVKIDHLEKLFDSKILAQEKILIEKEKSLADRVLKLENGENTRQDRIFQWKTVFVSASLGFILGIVATLIIGNITNS